MGVKQWWRASYELQGSVWHIYASMYLDEYVALIVLDDERDEPSVALRAFPWRPPIRFTEIDIWA